MNKIIEIFPEQPDLRPYMNDVLYKLRADYLYQDDDFYIHIPEGYICDIASIPFFFKFAADSDGLYRPAALIHDYCYEALKGVLSGWENAANVLPKTRKEADRLFYKVCLACGMNKFRAWLFYVSVRAGGWTYF